MTDKFDPATHRFGMAYDRGDGQIVHVVNYSPALQQAAFNHQCGTLIWGECSRFTRAPEHDLISHAECQPAPVSGVPDGWKLVPVEPTLMQWGELARDIIMWTRFDGKPTGKSLHYHLKAMGRKIPDWLADEIPDNNHVPPKGTVAVVIYKAMLEAAPQHPAPPPVTLDTLCQEITPDNRPGDAWSGFEEAPVVTQAEPYGEKK